MSTHAPPGDANSNSYPGVFICVPAILSVGPGVEVLGKVIAIPCRQAAAVVLQELEQKISRGENVVMMGVVGALDRKEGEGIFYKDVKGDESGEDHKEFQLKPRIELPGAADGSNAREVICCAIRKSRILCTASFHPKLTKDYRWHAYFYGMVKEFNSS